MPGGVQGDFYAVEFDVLAVVEAVDGDVVPQPAFEHGHAIGCGEISLRSPAGVVGMRVRHHIAGDWFPGVDVKIPRRAIQPAIGRDDERSICQGRILGRYVWVRGTFGGLEKIKSRARGLFLE